MSKLAIIKDGIVDNVIIGNKDEFPNTIDVTDKSPRPSPGWRYDNDTDSFSPPPKKPKYKIEAFADGETETVVSPGMDVTITIEAKKDGDKTTDFDGNVYRVPVIDVDGSKVAIIKLTIDNGIASDSFTPTGPGIYTVATDKTYPAVTERGILNAPVVIAE